MFGTYSGSLVNSIVRLNQDASIDTSFDMSDGFTYISTEGEGVNNILEYNNQYFCSTTFLKYDNTFIGNGNVLLDQTGSIVNNYGGYQGTLLGFEAPSATIFQRELPPTNLI